MARQFTARAAVRSRRIPGACDEKGSRVYVHVLDAPDQALLLPPLGAKILSAKFLVDGRPANVSEHDFGVVVRLPRDQLEPIGTVVVLDLDSKL